MLYEKNITIEEMFLEYEETGKWMGWNELVFNVIEYNELDYNKDTIMKIANDYVDELIEIGGDTVNKRTFMIDNMKRNYLNFYFMYELDDILEGKRPTDIIRMGLGNEDFNICDLYFNFWDQMCYNDIYSFNELEEISHEYTTLNDFLNKIEFDYTDFSELWEQEDEAILEMVRNEEIGNVYLY